MPRSLFRAIICITLQSQLTGSACTSGTDGADELKVSLSFCRLAPLWQRK